MARYLFVVPPLAGHVNPAVSLAAELSLRGHEVAWVGYRKRIGALLAADATLYELDEDTYDAIEAEFAAESLRVRGVESWALMSRKLLVPLAHAMLPGVENAIERFSPDVVITDQQALAGSLAAQRRGVKWATACTTAAGALVQPLTTLPKATAFIDDLFSRLQEDAGLPPMTRPDISPFLMLVFTSREFMPPDHYPDQYEFIGAAANQRPSETPFPWHQLDDSPAVLVSLGTLNADRGERFFRTVMKALGDEPLQVVMVAPPQLLSDAPANFIVRPHVPQLALLPKMSAVICHGGQNTVSESLAHGLPVVATPIKDDQTIIASFAARAGAGIRLKFGRLRAEDLRSAVRAVLDEPSYRAAAQRLGASFVAAGGAARGAELLEKLAAGGAAEGPDRLVAPQLR